MRTFPQAPVNTVERAFDRHVRRFVNLAGGTSILRVALAHAIVAPPSGPTIVRTRFRLTIKATEPRLAPAGAVKT